MHRIEDAIVQDGKVVLSQLPFPDGQHVRIIVDPTESLPAARKTIEEIRSILKGGVARFDSPFEPMIPSDDWELLK